MRRPSLRAVFLSFAGNFVLACGVLLCTEALLRGGCGACAPPQRTLAGIAAATCIVFARPALRGERSHRSGSLIPPQSAIDALFIGRLMGLALGVMTRLWLAALSR